MAFFSIILPTYNREHTIRRPIESVLNQTFTDWELIIVDDGSTDDTNAIVKSYKDPRIRYEWQENQERNAARQFGIFNSTADWICFIDSDDQYLPNHLSILYEAILDSPQHMIFYTEMEFVSNDGKIKPRNLYSENLNKNDPPDSLCLSAINKEVFLKVKLPNHLYSSEDFYFMALAGNIFGIKKLGIVSYRYYNEVSNNSLTGHQYHFHLKNKLKTFNELLTKHTGELVPFIKRNICVYSILLLYGHIKYKSKDFFKGIILNIKTLFKHPVTYILVVFRIIYVKSLEKLKIKNFDYRF